MLYGLLLDRGTKSSIRLCGRLRFSFLRQRAPNGCRQGLVNSPAWTPRASPPAPLAVQGVTGKCAVEVPIINTGVKDTMQRINAAMHTPSTLKYRQGREPHGEPMQNRATAARGSQPRWTSGLQVKWYGTTGIMGRCPDAWDTEAASVSCWTFVFIGGSRIDPNRPPGMQIERHGGSSSDVSPRLFDGMYMSMYIGERAGEFVG